MKNCGFVHKGVASTPQKPPALRISKLLEISDFALKC